jgi:hypothetical protein
MNHHVAELGDVWKHLPLAEMLRVNPPRPYWDTHAGSAWFHVDPFDPHERVTAQSRTPIELAGWLSNAGYRVFHWYGYDWADRRGWALEEITRLAPRARLWCGDALMPASLVYPGRPGAWGCGVVLANPMREEADTCERLGLALERAWESDTVPGAPARLRRPATGGSPS